MRYDQEETCSHTLVHETDEGVHDIEISVTVGYWQEHHPYGMGTAAENHCEPIGDAEIIVDGEPLTELEANERFGRDTVLDWIRETIEL